MSTLLVPIDFSETSFHALRFATEFAKEKRSSLLVLHVYQVPFDYALREEANNEVVGHYTKKKLAELETQYKNNESLKGLDVKFVAMAGTPGDDIVRYAEKVNAEMIIMGVTGAGAFTKAFLGSTTLEVAKTSKIPVLAVPKKGIMHRISKFLYNTDYRENDLDTIKKLIPLAKSLDNSIDVIHIAEKNSFHEKVLFEGFQEMVKKNIKFDKISFDLLFHHDFHSGMRDYLKGSPEAVWVMTQYKRSFPSLLFSKSITETIIERADIPVLIYNLP